MDNSHRGVLTALSDLLSGVDIARGSDVSKEQYTSALYQVVSEDDGCLVHALGTSTSIHKHSISWSALITVTYIDNIT